jgi:hypothetical protein
VRKDSTPVSSKRKIFKESYSTGQSVGRAGSARTPASATTSRPLPPLCISPAAYSSSCLLFRLLPPSPYPLAVGSFPMASDSASSANSSASSSESLSCLHGKRMTTLLSRWAEKRLYPSSASSIPISLLTMKLGHARPLLTNSTKIGASGLGSTAPPLMVRFLDQKSEIGKEIFLTFGSARGTPADLSSNKYTPMTPMPPPVAVTPTALRMMMSAWGFRSSLTHSKPQQSQERFTPFGSSFKICATGSPPSRKLMGMAPMEAAFSRREATWSML